MKNIRSKMGALAGAVLSFLILSSCQTKPKEIPLEFGDVAESYNHLDKDAKKKALDSVWAFYTATFNLEAFQKRMLENFPGLAIFDNEPTLLGKTALDLRPLRKTQVNPVALLLSVDLEMELLSRFHSAPNSNPRCLESFWSEWGFQLPAVSMGTPIATGRAPSQAPKVEAAPDVPLNETTKRLALYVRQSLKLSNDANLKLVAFESENRAQFKAPDGEVYEIFAAPIDCKTLQAKTFLVPSLGKLQCLQKQSATWMTVLAKESTVLGDEWVPEVQKRCQRWVRPITDKLRKEGYTERLKPSPLYKSWSLYPRMRAWVVREADRYETAFRKSVE